MAASSAILSLRLPGGNDGSRHMQTFVDAAAIGGPEPVAGISLHYVKADNAWRG